ncbi:MarR family winged helix-turn-helix transcriptional regulator [Nocardioides terrisoli]|uniref:MarR family winged helix-turn-helix transcriptional regulator n=1 Tax=Nocardioides terrisoli TaxID=3388267 RepID=UPI00287BC6C9|nr:MarR family transcriptional regulator [Nocardioides marmorisolisilvae]
MNAKPRDRAEATTALEHELSAIMRRIRRATSTRARMVDPQLPSAAYSILRSLHENGPQRSSALAEVFAIDKGAVSRQVALLEQFGFVERAPDPEDGRAQILTATGAAVERLREVDRLRRRWYEERLSDWSDAEIRELAVQLGRYNAAMD